MADGEFIREWPENKLTVAELRAILFALGETGPLFPEEAEKFESGKQKLSAAYDKTQGENA